LRAIISAIFFDNRLMPCSPRGREQQPGSVRILSVSSSGHTKCPGVDWSDLQQVREWVSANPIAWPSCATF